MTESNYSRGAASIGLERIRQIRDLGYTTDYDSNWDIGVLARAAACYADYAASELEDVSIDIPHPFWPWDAAAWNPGTPEEALVKAGALIAAQLDLFATEDKDSDG